MKSKIRVKKIHGKEYWYEDIPYYDKEKKQIRHRSKYLGKNIDGKPVKVRNVLDGDSKSNLFSPKSVTSFGYGELLPVLQIIKNLHIDRYMGKLLNKTQMNMALTLSINRVRSCNYCISVNVSRCSCFPTRIIHYL